uniref:PiggyBac transposable element-derived protein domain-containing protein n=1 Tax=Myripristis murdjan TaxID=586833 RepID=A0A667Z3N1_9TELE
AFPSPLTATQDNKSTSPCGDEISSSAAPCSPGQLGPPGEDDPSQNDDLPEPSWTSADNWNPPMEDDEDDEKCILTKFIQNSGPSHHLPKNSDAVDFFNLLFPSALMELITNETNAHAKTCQYLGTGSPDWMPVTVHEVKGFIGLVILMGIQTLPDPSHYWSWSHHDNSYTFYRAMSFKRFKQIAANIRMGSFTTDEYRGTSNPNDSLHIFRPMLDILSRAMWDAYQPNACLTIDRALLPGLEEEDRHSKGNPKTQPQVWLLCDSKSGYCHRFLIQMGAKNRQETGFSVVPELVEELEDKNHQIYLASSLTSVPLMQKLLDQGIYASSSFPPPSPILPRELWEEGQLEKAGDFLQRQFGPLLATRWKDTKEMGCLSTNASPGQPDTVWRRSQTKAGELDPIQRPMAFCLLQENMRGVDICKQLLACNPLGGILQDRHWRSLFWFLVNLSIVNAFIVLRESRKDNPPAWVQDGLFSQVNFRKRLGNQLAKCLPI